MLNKDRIMVMIRLAMREQEYGYEITKNGPHRKEYVGGHMFVFFLIESLLYLVFAAAVLLLVFMQKGFSLSVQALILIALALFILYLIITYVGEHIVRSYSIKRYELLKKARKAYMKDIDILHEMINDES